MTKRRRQRILLTHWGAPGDVVCMTACVRDLSLAYLGKYEIHIAGSCAELWENNPYVAKMWGVTVPSGMQQHRLVSRQSLIECLRQRKHYLSAFHLDLSRQLDVPLSPRFPHGDLHLTDAERTVPPLRNRYWLLVAGGKNDMPTKVWSAARFQEVVVQLRARGIQCVQCGSLSPGHYHPALENVVNLVGETSLRDVLRLVYHADGVIAPVTFVMHAAAAFEKRSVIIAGGREPSWWGAYINTPSRNFGTQCAPVAVPHHYLHTIGRLKCCRESGCWKSSVDGRDEIRTDQGCVETCDDGVGQRIPKCMALITPEEVVARVTQFHEQQAAGAEPAASRTGIYSVLVAKGSVGTNR